MASFQHFSHREHVLLFSHRWGLYNCDGCKEVGFGPRYRCNSCDFDLHESCARAPETVNLPYHTENLVFREKPFPSHVVCNLCGEHVSGFVYECRECNFDLHPSCANLPMTLQHPVHPHHMLQLQRYPEVQGQSECICDLCGVACTPGRWIYRCEASTTCYFYLHISCAKQPVDPMEQTRMHVILGMPSGHFPTATDSSLATSTPQARSRENSPENVSRATSTPQARSRENAPENVSRATSTPRARSHQNTPRNVSRVVEGVSNAMGFLSILSDSD